MSEWLRAGGAQLVATSVEGAVREAARLGVRVLCLPEPAPLLEPKVASHLPTLDRLGELARAHAMVIAAPLYEKEDETHLYLTTFVLNSTGELLGKVRKKPVPVSRGLWGGGRLRAGERGWGVFETSVGRLGVIASRAAHVPRHLATLAAQGVKLGMVPQAQLSSWSQTFWDPEVRLTSALQGIAVIVANRSGNVPGVREATYSGASRVLGRGGEPLAVAAPGFEGIVTAEIQLSEDSRPGLKMRLPLDAARSLWVRFSA